MRNQIVYCPLANDEPWSIPRLIEETVCPVCNKNVGDQIKTIAYYNCSWQIIGKIKGDEKSFKI